MCIHFTLLPRNMIFGILCCTINQTDSKDCFDTQPSKRIFQMWQNRSWPNPSLTRSSAQYFSFWCLDHLWSWSRSSTWRWTGVSHTCSSSRRTACCPGSRTGSLRIHPEQLQTMKVSKYSLIWVVFSSSPFNSFHPVLLQFRQGRNERGDKPCHTEFWEEGGGGVSIHCHFKIEK